MGGFAWVDWVGYLASALVVGSFLLNNLALVRWVNLAGCVCFVVYGWLLGPLWPIVVPNAILIVIHLQAFVRAKMGSDGD
ncbi:hypothetical protein [Rappaport israeli]|uniref:hypothetical protein n=1 Tax=Rappaport israeli TaxID=1839807 RepID=UPI0009304ED8|nr:hypothetical protein [Rappaport israeli]